MAVRWRHRSAIGLSAGIPAADLPRYAPEFRPSGRRQGRPAQPENQRSDFRTFDFGAPFRAVAALPCGRLSGRRPFLASGVSGLPLRKGREGVFRRDLSTHTEDMPHVRPRRRRSPFPLRHRPSLALVPHPPAARHRRPLPALRQGPRHRSREILRNVHRASARGFAEGLPQDAPSAPQPRTLPRLRNCPPAAQAQPLPCLQRDAPRSPSPCQAAPPGGTPRGGPVPAVRQECSRAGQHLVRRLPRRPPSGTPGTHSAPQAPGDSFRLHRLRRRNPCPCVQALPGLPGVAAPAGKGGGSRRAGAAPRARHLHCLRPGLRSPRAEGMSVLSRCMGARLLAQQADAPGAGSLRAVRQAALRSRLRQL